MNKFKKISIILLILISTIFAVLVNKSIAASGSNITVGTTYTISYNTLRNAASIMCIQHGQALHGSPTYTVSKIVNIGPEYGTSNILEAVLDGTDKRVQNKINARIAYIVYHAINNNSGYYNGGGYPNTPQRLIWNKDNGYKAWYEAVGKELGAYAPSGNQSMDDKTKELSAKAKTYADFAEAYLNFYIEHNFQRWNTKNIIIR